MFINAKNDIVHPLALHLLLRLVLRLDPLIWARPRKENLSNQLPASNSSTPQNLTPSSRYPLSTANQKPVNNSIYATPDKVPTPAGKSPLNSVRAIKEFNGSVKKLDDLLMSVEAHLTAYIKSSSSQEPKRLVPKNHMEANSTDDKIGLHFIINILDAIQNFIC